MLDVYAGCDSLSASLRLRNCAYVFAVPKIDLIDLLELPTDQGGEESAPQLPLLPAGLVVTESFDEAVDVVEREALTRALAASDGRERVTHWEPY